MDATILRPAEWVLPGHPDKLADAIADALVQAAQRRQPEALCAVEVAVHRDAVFVTGRIACDGASGIDLPALVRGVYASAGYGGTWRPAPDAIVVAGNPCVEPLVPGEADIRHVSDDQSIVTGHAVDLPDIGWMPPEQWLAREVARRLFDEVSGPLALCPDGKVLVVLAERGEVRRLHAASCSLLAHAGDVALQRMAVAAIAAACTALAARLPGFDPALPEEIVVSGSGTFVEGGPEGDNGLSGKKLLLDHYGPRVAVGGTALSGKDLWKPDRAGTLVARRLALAVVRSGQAREATVQCVAFPGDEAPRFVRVVTPDGELPDARRWLDVMDCRFATAAHWIADPGLDLVDVARWGGFGRGAPWERLGMC
jgi:S-adenosylmethionine synthetase